MTKKSISNGVVHKVPADLQAVLLTDPRVLAAWESLTPLARNEWICWVISVTFLETRQNHIKRARAELKQGKRRPCCWYGCIHRKDKPISSTAKWVMSRQKNRG